MDFGWIFRIPVKAVWGLIIKPVGRVTFGTLGAVGGVGYAVVSPAVKTVYHLLHAPVMGAFDVVLMGTLWPAVMLVWHHGAWVPSIITRAPDPEDGDHWWMHFYPMNTKDDALGKIDQFFMELKMFVSDEAFRGAVLEEMKGDTKCLSGRYTAYNETAEEALERERCFGEAWEGFMASISEDEKRSLELLKEVGLEEVSRECFYGVFVAHLQSGYRNECALNK